MIEVAGTLLFWPDVQLQNLRRVRCLAGARTHPCNVAGVRPLLIRHGHGWIKVDVSSLGDGFLLLLVTPPAACEPLDLAGTQAASHRFQRITTSKRQHFLEEPLKTNFMTLPISVLFLFNLLPGGTLPHRWANARYPAVT